MTKLSLIITGVLCCVTCSMLQANTLFASLKLVAAPASVNNYTLLDDTNYQQTVSESRAEIQQIIQGLASFRNQSLDNQIVRIVAEFLDRPYSTIGLAGEGDWVPGSLTYKPGAVHVQQDPVYRTDKLDCQTFVEIAMAMLHANSLAEFERNFLQISYGAAGNLQNEYVHFYNRNNFIEGDFNPLNEQHGTLIDVTSQQLTDKTLSATITRQNWFNHLQKKLAQNVRVLHEQDGPAMVKRFLTVYANLNYPNFKSQKITISYIPKADFVLVQADGSYQPNQKLLNQIPTPAVVEGIRDPSQWMIGGKSVQEAIGSELTVSHMGLLYRQTFTQGEVIYQDIRCYMHNASKVCEVTPVRCAEATCTEVMMAHATERYPNNYYWYAKADGSYVCTPQAPAAGTAIKYCNRIEAVPLFNYLTSYQYGTYVYMDNASVLGVHVEKLR